MRGTSISLFNRRWLEYVPIPLFAFLISMHSRLSGSAYGLGGEGEGQNVRSAISTSGKQTRRKDRLYRSKMPTGTAAQSQYRMSEMQDRRDGE